VQPVPLTNTEGAISPEEPTPAVVDTAPAPDLPPVATNDPPPAQEESGDPTPEQAAYGADQSYQSVIQTLVRDVVADSNMVQDLQRQQAQLLQQQNTVANQVQASTTERTADAVRVVHLGRSTCPAISGPRSTTLAPLRTLQPHTNPRSPSAQTPTPHDAAPPPCTVFYIEAF